MITQAEYDEFKNAFYADFDKLPDCHWWKVEHMYAYARENRCVKACEIGVFHGKSFMSLAFACKQNNGMAIGIDPWKVEDAMQVLTKELEHINGETSKMDFEVIYQEVLSNFSKYNLMSNCKFIRKRSEDAISDPDINDIDLLHIDGNHGEEAVRKDFEMYYPKVKRGGIIWFDDFHPVWPTIIPTVEHAKSKCMLLEAVNAQAIFVKN